MHSIIESEQKKNKNRDMKTNRPCLTVDGQHPQLDWTLLYNSANEFQINNMPPAQPGVLDVEECGMELCK